MSAWNPPNGIAEAFERSIKAGDQCLLSFQLHEQADELARAQIRRGGSVEGLLKIGERAEAQNFEARAEMLRLLEYIATELKAIDDDSPEAVDLTSWLLRHAARLKERSAARKQSSEKPWKFDELRRFLKQSGGTLVRLRK